MEASSSTSGSATWTVESFDTLFWFQLNYPGELGGNFPPVYRDIVFENFSVEKVGTVFDAQGPEGAPLRDVLLKNVTITAAEKPLVLENVEGLRFENVLIGKQRIDGALNWR